MVRMKIKKNSGYRGEIIGFVVDVKFSKDGFRGMAICHIDDGLRDTAYIWSMVNDMVLTLRGLGWSL